MQHFITHLFGTPDGAYIEAFVADTTPYTRKALLVIPGGGYGSVCSDREGEPIAMAFMPYGYNTFVLHYTVARKKKFPAQLIEASAAMRYIKDNAKSLHIDPDQVFATGFSAGGHLCASLGVLWKRPEIYEILGIPYGYNRPRGIMPIYPVISADPEIAHKGSFCNLLCSDSPTQEELDMCSIEKNVDADSSPAFIVHTVTDQIVDVRNSLVLANAYTEKKVPYELHIFPDAPHGMALGNAITAGNCEKFNNPCLADWVRLAANWADEVCKNNR